MQLLVGRLVRELANGLAELGERLAGKIVERRLRSAGREPVDRLDRVVEERQVLVGAKGGEQPSSGAGTLPPQSREQRSRLLRILAPELDRLALEALEEDVEVAHVAERTA